jgi:copper chaperone CopZ
MRQILLILGALLFFSAPTIAKPNDDTMLTTTFLVVMPKAKSAEVTKTLKKQAGVKKVETNLKDQTVIVTFSAEENTVSNLLKQFKQMGVTAAAMETGCFGSKEGCINAIKPENTMR